MSTGNVAQRDPTNGRCARAALAGLLAVLLAPMVGCYAPLVRFALTPAWSDMDYIKYYHRRISECEQERDRYIRDRDALEPQMDALVDKPPDQRTHTDEAVLLTYVLYDRAAQECDDEIHRLEGYVTNRRQRIRQRRTQNLSRLLQRQPPAAVPTSTDHHP